MRKHVPTRRCPHRFCGPLHIGIAITALAAAVTASNLEPRFVGVLAISCLAVFAATIAVHRKTPVQMLRAEAEEASQDSARTTNLVIHHGYARAALAMDVVVMAATLVSMGTILNMTGRSTAQGAAPSWGALIVGTGACLLWNWLHRRATRPGKSLRFKIPQTS
ncbi:hypothetical protein [Streptomyces sp. NPDC048272]|uniref:hypothetical protein n=1 Tax=Streptomyces sp. NPDC048272 TaxID=3154616 RepID=UPI00341B3E7F